MGSPWKRSAERPNDWLCGSVSGIMVIRREGVPDAILEMMVLAMSKILSIAQGHLFTTVPKTEVIEETEVNGRKWVTY